MRAIVVIAFLFVAGSAQLTLNTCYGTCPEMCESSQPVPDQYCAAYDGNWAVQFTYDSTTVCDGLNDTVISYVVFNDIDGPGPNGWCDQGNVYATGTTYVGACMYSYTGSGNHFVGTLSCPPTPAPTTGAPTTAAPTTAAPTTAAPTTAAPTPGPVPPDTCVGSATVTFFNCSSWDGSSSGPQSCANCVETSVPVNSCSNNCLGIYSAAASCYLTCSEPGWLSAELFSQPNCVNSTNSGTGWPLNDCMFGGDLPYAIMFEAGP